MTEKKEEDVKFDPHKCAFRGNITLVKEYLSKKSESTVDEIRDNNNATLLHHSCFKGHLELTKLLVSKYNHSVDVLDNDVCTPLHNSSFSGKIRCTSYLAGQGANVDHKDMDGATPLHKACFNGHLEVIKFLLDKCKASVDIEDNLGVSALQKACFKGNLHVVDYLVTVGGARVDGVDHSGSTALHKASFNGNVECARVLLMNGAFLDQADKEGTTALHNAVYNGHFELVKLLVENGAAFDVRTMKYRSSPLHFAAFNGHHECLRILVDHGAELDPKDSKNMTPFHYAVKRMQIECLEILIEKKCDLKARDLKGRAWTDMTNSDTIISVIKSQMKGEGSGTFEKDEKAKPYFISSKRSVSAADGWRNSVRETDDDDILKIYGQLDRNGFLSKHEGQLSEKESQLELERSMKWNKMFAKWEFPGKRPCLFLQKSGSFSGSHSLPSSESLPSPPSSPIIQSKAVEQPEPSLPSKITGLTGTRKAMMQAAKKIRSRCEKGIPARVRGTAWQLLAGIPVNLVNSTTNPLHNKAGQYLDLLACEIDRKTEKQIRLDITRTFPENVFLMEKGGQESLFNVLRAQAAHDPDTGYCQGMGFVSGLLLMYIEEEDAFWMLNTLCSEYGMSYLWKAEFPGLMKSFWVLDKLLELFLPKLHSHFQKEELNSDMYATQWFLTAYLYSLPFNIVLRLWDVLLFEGYSFLYCVALGIFRHFKTKLLSLQFMELFKFLHFEEESKEGNNVAFDVEVLLKDAIGFRDKVNRSLKGLYQQYEQEMVV